MKKMPFSFLLTAASKNLPVFTCLAVQVPVSEDGDPLLSHLQVRVISSGLTTRSGSAETIRAVQSPCNSYTGFKHQHFMQGTLLYSFVTSANL